MVRVIFTLLALAAAPGMAADGRPGLVIGMAVGQLRWAVDLRGISPRRA